jgi:hypothetical protein
MLIGISKEIKTTHPSRQKLVRSGDINGFREVLD